VHVLGWAQTHPGYRWERGSDFGIVSGAAISGPEALKMAEHSTMILSPHPHS
jgi:hypothetical protein